jgi:hypothetical protein
MLHAEQVLSLVHYSLNNLSPDTDCDSFTPVLLTVVRSLTYKNPKTNGFETFALLNHLSGVSK